MAEQKLNFLLLGKTGEGKSATGNTLLCRKYFKTSSFATSETKEVDFSFCQFGPFVLQIVDGPGLCDTEKTRLQDTSDAVTNMATAVTMCYGGVNAFLFVIRFGIRFTQEEKSTLDSLKRILGDHFLKHLIVIITGGDLFQRAAEEEHRGMTFQEWCQRQQGTLGELYKECQGRFILFNNIETDTFKKNEQVQRVIDVAQGFHGRYTSEFFQKAEREREKLVLELRAPELNIQIQQELSLLTADIQALSKTPSDDQKKKIRSRIHEINNRISSYDKGHGVLADLMKIVARVEENLDDVEKLHKLAQEIESKRKSRNTWAIVGGAAAALIGGVVAVASLPVAAVAAGATAIGTGIRSLKLHLDKNKLEKEHKELSSKRM